jgi:hypothetical protein
MLVFKQLLTFLKRPVPLNNLLGFFKIYLLQVTIGWQCDIWHYCLWKHFLRQHFFILKCFHIFQIAIAGKCGVYNCLCKHNLRLSILLQSGFCLIENFYLFLITNANICDKSLINLPLVMHLKLIDLFH